MAEPVLAVWRLNGYHGQAHVLHDVSFVVEKEPTALIGRNGMGKTTLCLAIMGLLRSASGSIRLEGRELLGRPPHTIAAAGVGYVPQGRLLFPSLSVDEHLRLAAGVGRRRGRWTVTRIYELFPQLAARKQLSGTQLSGGEQQMLAIGRALLSNPRLLLMDEPSEGLAPRIVQELVSVIRGLVSEGMGLIVVEQNLGVATALAERQLVMITGQIRVETTAAQLRANPAAAQQYLGVGTSFATGAAAGGKSSQYSGS